MVNGDYMLNVHVYKYGYQQKGTAVSTAPCKKLTAWGGTWAFPPPIAVAVAEASADALTEHTGGGGGASAGI